MALRDSKDEKSSYWPKIRCIVELSIHLFSRSIYFSSLPKHFSNGLTIFPYILIFNPKKRRRKRCENGQHKEAFTSLIFWRQSWALSRTISTLFFLFVTTLWPIMLLFFWIFPVDDVDAWSSKLSMAYFLFLCFCLFWQFDDSVQCINNNLIAIYTFLKNYAVYSIYVYPT